MPEWRSGDDWDAHYRAQSFWLDAVPGRLDPRPSLTGDTTADVAIIGAGYTGLWTAWYLKQHAPHLDVALLEAEIAGFGASGRNGGWCSAYLAGLAHWAADPATREGAVTLQREMVAAVDEVGRVSCLAGFDCHYDKSGHVSLAMNAHQLRREHQEQALWRSLGFGDEDIRILEPQALDRRLRVNGVLGGGFMAHCATIQPAILARGLAKAVVARGVRLFERSPVREWKDGEVLTPGGRLRAGVVLLATEAFTGTLKGFSRRIAPVHSTMIVTGRLSPEALEATGLRRRFGWGDGRHRVTYGQLTRDGRIAFGARGRYYWGSRLRTRFEAGDPVFTTVRGELDRLFPALRDTPVTHAWGGPMGIARTLRPAVVFDPECGAGWAGGYLGDGVGAANLAGRTLADLVLDRDTPRRRTPWVNPPGLTAPPGRAWEPEPLRWLGFNALYSAMGRADAAEAAGRRSADRWNWLMEKMLP